MKEIYDESYTIKGLMRLFDKKILAVPEIQREFVWNAKKACALVDSIYRNYPIGTAMIWETNRNNHSLLRHKLHILPQFDHKNKDGYFIIDGQQRLSVLYHLTKGDKILNSNHQELDFDRIFFSLYEEESDLRFEYLKSPDPDKYVRLCDILDPCWRNKLSNLPMYKLNVVRRCRELILNYRSSCTRVDKFLLFLREAIFSGSIEVIFCSPPLRGGDEGEGVYISDKKTDASCKKP